jgi:hypothetical protein
LVARDTARRRVDEISRFARPLDACHTAPMDREAKRAFEKKAAECVVELVPEVTLIEMREAPDADLLHANGSHVGLEIVETVDPRPLHLQKRLRAASDAIRTELVNRNITGVYRVYYDLDEMGENMRAWNRDVPARFAQFFTGRVPTRRVEAAELDAHQISGIASIEVESADRTFVGVGWSIVTAEGETLADIALASKHAKLTKYRKTNGEHFRNYWLAIASLGPGTMEDGGYSLLLNRTFQTDFDRVFLLWHGSNGRLERAEDITPTGST